MPDIDHIIENHIRPVSPPARLDVHCGRDDCHYYWYLHQGVARWSSWPPTVRGFIHEVALGARRHVDRHDPVPELLSPAIR